MIKTDWSITSQCWNWTREDFLFTYSEEEKQENAVNKNNAWLIFYADYYPRYNSLLKLDTTLEEDIVISFLYYWTKSWKYIYVKNEDLALLIKWSVATATRVVKSLVDKWYIDIKIKRIIWAWTDRKLRLNPTKIILISQINQNDVSETSNWGVIKEYIENNKINKGNQNSDKLDDKLLDALQEFREMRKMIKKPLTSRAEKRLIAKLDKLWKNDDEKVDILHQSIDHCWQDVYELQTNKNSTQNKQVFPLEEIKQAAVSYWMYYQKKPEFAKPYAELLKKYWLLDNWKRKEYANMILWTWFIS